MKRADFIRLKAELLCNGMRITDGARAELLREYPHFFVKGFVHATNLSVYGSNMCVSIADGYSLNSKHTLCKDERGFRIKGEGVDVPVEFFGALPETGTVIDGMVQLHAPGCINIWPSSTCCYDTDELKCRFCSLEKLRSAPASPKEIADGLQKLLFALGKGYMINISGGTYISPDSMADYYIELVKRIREFSDCPIAIELAPPSDKVKLKELKEAGCNVVIMNIEIASPELRKSICPGKSRISYEHYHECLRYAVDIFGYGMVSSVLIGGIQPESDIITECEKLSDEGVFPTIMPFRPFDNCELCGFSPCSPDELIRMSERLGEMLRGKGLAPEKQPGCTECGGCSIENDCYKIAPSVGAEKVL